MSSVDKQSILAYLSTPHAVEPAAPRDEGVRRTATDSSSLDKEAILSYLSVPRPMPAAVQERPQAVARPKETKSLLNYLSIATSRVFGGSKKTKEEMPPRQYAHIVPPRPNLNQDPDENWVVIDDYAPSSCTTPPSSGSLAQTRIYPIASPFLPTNPQRAISGASLPANASNLYPSLTQLMNSPPVAYPSLSPSAPLLAPTNTSSREPAHAPIISGTQPLSAGHSATPPSSTLSLPPAHAAAPALPLTRTSNLLLPATSGVLGGPAVLVSAPVEANSMSASSGAVAVQRPQHPMFSQLRPTSESNGANLVSSPLPPDAQPASSSSSLPAVLLQQGLSKASVIQPAIPLDASLSPAQVKRIQEV